MKDEERDLLREIEEGMAEARRVIACKHMWEEQPTVKGIRYRYKCTRCKAVKVVLDE